MSKTEDTLLPEFQKLCAQIGQGAVQRARVQRRLSDINREERLLLGKISDMDIEIDALVENALSIDSATPYAKRVEDALSSDAKGVLAE